MPISGWPQPMTFTPFGPAASVCGAAVVSPSYAIRTPHTDVHFVDSAMSWATTASFAPLNGAGAFAWLYLQCSVPCQRAGAPNMNLNFETAADLCAGAAPGAGLVAKSCSWSAAYVSDCEAAMNDTAATAIDAPVRPHLPKGFRMRASSDDLRRNLIGRRLMP